MITPSSTVGALAIAFIVFGLPELIKPAWPAYLSWLGGTTQAAFVWGPLVASGAVTLVGNFVYAVIYAAGVPAFEAYRVNKSSPWPWAAPAPAARAAFWRLTAASVALTTLNHLLLVAATWLNWPLAAALGFRASTADFPRPLEVCAHLALFALLEDAAFYWGHRALHEVPSWYMHVHKMHHQYAHTVAVAVLHLHPLEFLICNVLPVGLGPLLVGGHAYTGLLWVALRVAQTQEAHSGYKWPWSPFRWLPANGSGEAHDAHHSLNTGNYGSLFGFWDDLCGTRIAASAVAAKYRDRAATSGPRTLLKKS